MIQHDTASIFIENDARALPVKCGNFYRNTIAKNIIYILEECWLMEEMGKMKNEGKIEKIRNLPQKNSSFLYEYKLKDE
ncbi:MAG: hypothetical protein HY051_03215 [Candidatus Aenigmarchaeota archaeon]|nr:hypothetical protein [Candidatus Aenigmarchaeota archaeon]